MIEPIINVGDHKNRTSGAGRFLVSFFEAHTVGHVVEALHYCLGHRKANPGSRLSVLLTALAPTELDKLCPFVEKVYPVELPGYPVDTSGLSEADCLAALRDVPKDWDYVVDTPAGAWRLICGRFPGLPVTMRPPIGTSAPGRLA